MTSPMRQEAWEESNNVGIAPQTTRWVRACRRNHQLKRLVLLLPPLLPQLQPSHQSVTRIPIQKQITMASPYPHYAWAAGHFILLLCSMRYLLAWVTFKSSAYEIWYRCAFSLSPLSLPSKTDRWHNLPNSCVHGSDRQLCNCCLVSFRCGLDRVIPGPHPPPAVRHPVLINRHPFTL